MWLDFCPWTVSQKLRWLKISTEERTHRMSKVRPFIWVLSLDYDFEWNWGLSRSGFNFTESRCLPLGPYKIVCESSGCLPRTLFGSNFSGRVECSMYPKIFLQPEPCKVPGKLPGVFDFFGSARGSEIRFWRQFLLPTTVNRSSCFRWRNTTVFAGCSQEVGDWRGANGCGDTSNCANQGEWGRRFKRVGVVFVIWSPSCLTVLVLPWRGW